MGTPITSASLAPSSNAPLPTGYDMCDSDKDKTRWPGLATALHLCEQTICPVYEEADRRALRHQRRHKRAATVAAVCGTFAVLFAIVDASKLSERLWIAGLEIVFVSIALLAVILGLALRFHKQWLIQRNKAERCRFLKFRFLIQPALWSGDAAVVQTCANELRQAVDELRAFNRVEQMEEWATTEELMELLSTHEYGPAAASVLPELTDYYQDKRVRYQLEFLKRRIGRNELWNRLTVHWPFWLFFASIVFALLHFACRIRNQQQESPAVQWFIFLAAALPALSAGVSSLRAAHQFARNKKHYQHCQDALNKLSAHLRKETPPAIRFRDFVMCESKLESEHRNWLHLMTEAEWF